MSDQEFVIGEAPHVTGTWKVGGVLTDPTVITLIVEDPTGAETTYTFPSAPITRDSVGQYSADLAPAILGLWHARFVGTGAAAGAQETSFYIVTRLSQPRYTYDLTTAVGKLRLLIQDTDLSAVSPALRLEQRSAAFSDAELSAFLELRGNDLYMGASLALRTWATSKQLIVVTRKNGQGSVEFGTVRADMLKMAEGYEQMAREQPADAYAEMDWNDFSLRRILDNAQLRSWNE